ncbi:Retrovirus-related Pol polyprotein from transposon 17.6 [Nosema granulosis]|uniref:Retrovirus-related Pol polyprotein from transposon 17.6 n=1 Tax=Nosema granulosis TaxID=83296 RepID=A0A9P6GZF8_9MICR|nr:Retrovirus-related Pol polyprotein from transposon 17.6 [Nosema granulosis]
MQRASNVSKDDGSSFLKERSIFILVYLDDIIVYSSNIEEHKKQLEIVMDRLKASRLSLNRNKCNFYRSEIKILGNIVSKGTIKPDQEKKSCHQNIFRTYYYYHQRT